MKVWIVTKESWEDTTILQVFDSEEKAEKCVELLNEQNNKDEHWESRAYYDLTEFEVN